MEVLIFSVFGLALVYITLLFRFYKRVYKNKVETASLTKQKKDIEEYLASNQVGKLEYCILKHNLRISLILILIWFTVCIVSEILSYE